MANALLPPDTSSYADPVGNALLAKGWDGNAAIQQVQGVQNLQSGQVALSKAQLDLGLQHLAVQHQQLGALVNNPTLNNFQNQLKLLVQNGAMDPDAAAQEATRVAAFNITDPDAPNPQIKQYAFDNLSQVASHADLIKEAYGSQGLVNTGGATVPIVQRDGPQGGTFIGSGAPIPNTMTPAEKVAAGKTVTNPDNSTTFVPGSHLYDERGNFVGDGSAPSIPVYRGAGAASPPPASTTGQGAPAPISFGGAPADQPAGAAASPSPTGQAAAPAGRVPVGYPTPSGPGSGTRSNVPAPAGQGGGMSGNQGQPATGPGASSAPSGSPAGQPTTSGVGLPAPRQGGLTMSLSPGQQASLTAGSNGYLKQSLDDRIGRAQRVGRNDDARIYTGLKSALTNAVDTHPDASVRGAWQAAREAYAGPSRELGALDAGRAALGPNVTPEALSREYAALGTDLERQRYREGLFSAGRDLLARKGDGSNFVDAIAGNQAVREKLAAVAPSPEAYGRFGQALDTARRTFTEAQRPDVVSLHRTLDALDTKAKVGDAGVTAARDALGAVLEQNPDFARGRALQASYNELTGAIDDGATALRSGPDAIHPEDFADRFGARTPAGQAAERLAMRNQVDRALGQKANDLVALRNTLQGEDGWNAAKVRTAFGEDAGNDLTRTLLREGAFGKRDNDVVNNSVTAPKLAGAALANKPSRHSINLANITTLGAPVQAAKSLLLDPAIKALLDSPTGPRNLEIAKALIAPGATRDKILTQIERIESRKASVAAAGDALRSGTRNAGNALTLAAAPAAAQKASGSKADNELTRAGRRGGASIRNLLMPADD